MVVDIEEENQCFVDPNMPSPVNDLRVSNAMKKLLEKSGIMNRSNIRNVEGIILGILY